MRKAIYLVRRVEYVLNGIGVNIDEKAVIFESYNGKSYSCSPKAIYEYMLQNDKYEEYTFTWIVKHPDEYEFLTKNPRTQIVRYRSKQCEKALHRARYWIFNYRALDQWIPDEKQVYVQCWHGTPLKRLGFDIKHSDNAMNSKSEIRDKYVKDAKRFKYLLSPCRFTSEKFTTAWNLKEYGKEDTILEVGYPRNDYLINQNQDDVTKIRAKLGFENDDRKLILYAPTWRDNQHSSGSGYTYRCEADFDLLRQMLGDGYAILFRAHYLVASSFDFSMYDGFVYDVSDVDDINELYIVSDMLITDYSSVFFDYAILQRPIFFYMYDLEEYRDDVRGFYLGLDELPGKIVTGICELAEEIKKADILWQPDERYEDFNMRFNYLNDGNAAERFVERVL